MAGCLAESLPALTDPQAVLAPCSCTFSGLKLNMEQPSPTKAESAPCEL